MACGGVKDRGAEAALPFVCGLPLKNRDGSPLLQTNRMPLTTDKVRYVGDAVAFVVAETVAQARDVAFLLNDRADLVAATGCDGAHVGQEDMPAR